MFNSTQSVLEKTEKLLISQTHKNKYVKYLSNHIGSPFTFLLLGLDEASSSMKNLAWIFIALLVATWPLSYFLQEDANPEHKFFYIVCAISFIVTIFSLPSVFFFLGVDEMEVKKVAGYIEDEIIYTVEDVGLLEQNLTVIFQSIHNRVKFYNFTIAGAWGFYMYYLNVGVMIWIKSSMANDVPNFANHMSSLIPVIFITLIALFFVFAYKKAGERLIKTIQFACVQVKYNLAEE